MSSDERIQAAREAYDATYHREFAAYMAHRWRYRLKYYLTRLIHRMFGQTS